MSRWYHECTRVYRANARMAPCTPSAGSQGRQTSVGSVFAPPLCLLRSVPAVQRVYRAMRSMERLLTNRMYPNRGVHTAARAAAVAAAQCEI